MTVVAYFFSTAALLLYSLSYFFNSKKTYLVLRLSGNVFFSFSYLAIGAYVPITDLAAWAEENKSYRGSVLACCGGDAAEMTKRSPMSYIDTIARANLKIFHGKHDPCVPFTHSLRLYNALLAKYPEASVYLDIFDGGHEIDMQTAVYRILSQYESAEKTEITG